MNQLTAYTLRLGDNCLVLSQRLGEWCGHAPELEIDLALANIGLDLLGQARNFLSYAAELAGEGDEDTLAFTRWLNSQTAILPTPLHASISSMHGMWRSLPV